MQNAMALLLAAVAVAHAASTADGAQQQPPPRYLIADYSPERQRGWSSRVYWFEPDERTECYLYEAGGTYGNNGMGVGGGISCLRKESR